MGFTRKAVWATEKPGYTALHDWVRRNLGTPLVCSKCGNDKLSRRSYHWANISQDYKKDLSDWVRLCVSCHFTVITDAYKCGHKVDGNTFINSSTNKKQCRICKNEANRKYRIRLKEKK